MQRNDFEWLLWSNINTINVSDCDQRIKNNNEIKDEKSIDIANVIRHSGDRREYIVCTKIRIFFLLILCNIEATLECLHSYVVVVFVLAHAHNYPESKEKRNSAYEIKGYRAPISKELIMMTWQKTETTAEKTQSKWTDYLREWNWMHRHMATGFFLSRRCSRDTCITRCLNTKMLKVELNDSHKLIEMLMSHWRCSVAYYYIPDTRRPRNSQ